MIRRILYALYMHHSLSGDELTNLVDADDGRRVTGVIHNFRLRVKQIMLAKANMTINPEIDVLIIDRQHGYRFSDKIVVMDGQELSVPNQKNGKTKDITKWILSEIQKSGRVRRKQITDRTGHSESTIRRNLVKLRNEERIVFEGSSRSGYWRLV